MAFTPWMTSTDLIAAVKRKIALPISQNTFTEDDILAFANEEMMISQVPSMLEYHEEYFVFLQNVPLQTNRLAYPIPTRAIGMRLRDVTYIDDQGNFFEMTRISPDDKAYFQNSVTPSSLLSAYYLQGNDIILTPNNITNPTGSLQFSYFLRPNQLVHNDRAAIIQNFNRTVTVDITTLVAGDTITIDGVAYTAVAAAPTGNEFLIGVSNVATATNLINTINSSGNVPTAIPTTPASALLNIMYFDRNMVIETSNTAAFAIQVTLGINFDQMPANITNNSFVDFLQTLPGHKTYKFDVKVPNGGISSTVINFVDSDVPDSLITGDYICSANECIIPQIPPDLHNGLAERTCARILASLGDQEGLGNVNQKLAEIEKRQGNLLDQRIDGAPQKVVNRHSILRYGKVRIFGRF